MTMPRLAFGYLRLDRPDDERLDGLRSELLAFCRRTGVRLVNVFHDHDPEHDDGGWLGFAQLLSAVRQRPNSVVVIPNVAHLGTNETARQTYLTVVSAATAALWVVQDSPATPTEQAWTNLVAGVAVAVRAHAEHRAQRIGVAV